jgi:GNAT superfamily N-acetyltransferase
MPVTTRLATAADHELLRRIHHAAYRDVVERQFGRWDEAEQDSYFEKSLGGHDIAIIELDGRAIGSLAVVESESSVQLLEIQILPEYQSRGFGTQLVQCELARAASLGKPLRLQVLRANRARELYERLGLRVVGHTQIHYLMSTI